MPNSNRYVDGVILDDAFVAYLDHQRIDANDRVDLLKRALLPGTQLGDHFIGDTNDRIAADIPAIDFGQVQTPNF